MLFSFLLINIFPQSLEERVAEFSNLSGKEQVDTLLEFYSNNVYFERRAQFARFVHIIIGNPDSTREYILEKLKNTKPVPYDQIPCTFEILYSILEEARRKNDMYHFYISMDDYKETVHDLYVMKMDEYLREYKTIDFRYKELLDSIWFMETGESHITTLEDLPVILEGLTAKGYEDLTINTEHIYSRSLFEGYGIKFDD